MIPQNFICTKCKHFKPISGGCSAFEEIPVKDILENGHSTPYPSQNNSIIFEEGKSEESKYFI